MNEREIEHYRARFHSLMEGTGTPNERAALALRYFREIERAGMPPCLVDLHGRFRAIEAVARAIDRAAQEAGCTYRCGVIREKFNNRSKPAPRPETQPQRPDILVPPARFRPFRRA